VKRGGVCSAHRKRSVVVVILKIRISVGGEIFCPCLGSHFPRGNIYRGRTISQQSAASLPMFRQNQVPSLVYDESKDGFCPRQWRFHVNRDENKCLFLLPIGQDGDGNYYSNMVHVHRSRYEKENSFLYASTSKLINKRNAVRTTKGWGGTGKMVGIGEHTDRNGNHCNFVIKPEMRNQWKNEAEKITLNECGNIFKKHFGDKPVRFKEMIQQQRFL
jgi:hypothetical protein